MKTLNGTLWFHKKCKLLYRVEVIENAWGAAQQVISLDLNIKNNPKQKFEKFTIGAWINRKDMKDGGFTLLSSLN